jgi:YihY family inner membrane protein
MLSSTIRSIDRFQQRHPAAAFLLAVIKKYGDDQGGQLAALITYYAFFSVFPLLLVAVTVLGYALEGDRSLQNDILNSFVRDIPVLGDQLVHNGVRSLNGSALALAVGLAVSLWSGLGVTQATQSAFNRIWHVPFKQRPDFLRSRLRGLILLFALGAMTIASTALTGIVSAGASGPLAGIAALALSLILNVALFLVCFRLLTSIELSWYAVLPGAVVAGIAWEVVQTAGSLLFTHKLNHLNATYGTFATVIGLLSLLYLGAQVMLIAAEINVVAARRLWPRGLTQPLTSADKRSLTGSAETEERVHEETVTVTFDGTREAAPGG